MSRERPTAQEKIEWAGTDVTPLGQPDPYGSDPPGSQGVTGD